MNAWYTGNTKVARRIHSYLTVLEINEDNNVLLGACELGGSQWNGCLCLFKKPEDAPDLSKSEAVISVDVGVTDAKFLPNGVKVLYADYSGNVVLLELQKSTDDCPSTPIILAEFKSHEDYVTSLDLLSNEKIVSASIDSTAILWEIENAVATRTLFHASSVVSVVKRPEHEETFASICRDGTVVLWDCRQERPATAHSVTSVPLTSLDWTGNDSIVVGSVSGSLSLMDARNFKEVAFCRLSFKHGVRRMRAHRQSSLLACTVDDLSLRVLSMQPNSTFSEIQQSCKHKDFVSGLGWESTGEKLWTSGWDTKVFSYDVDVPVKDQISEPSTEKNNLELSGTPESAEW